MTFAARTASDPKIVFNAAVCCSWLMPFSPAVNCAIVGWIPTKLPFASNTSTPSFFIDAAAGPVVADKDCSIVLNDVPASDPTMPETPGALDLSGLGVKGTPEGPAE